jgi:LAO/AO transport system kinase
VPTSISTWVDEIRGGNLRALSQAITAVENRTPESHALLQALFAYSGRARIVGVTGSPGAGKSTLVDALAGQFRARRQTVGIIAIDPTSPFSGGAILGDRIRMQSHSADDGIFIRSMATRGALGGLCSAAADVATVLDSSGRDLVLIETVGAGQDEVDIVRLADLTLVVLVPGMGDDVQSIKAGILEIADIFVINKSDREGAARVERDLRAMQSLSTRADGWVPPIVQTVATSGTGIGALLAAIDEYESFLAANSLGLQRRIANWRIRLREMLRDELLRRIAAQTLSEDAMAQYAAQVAAHQRDPYSLIAELAAQCAAQSAAQAENPSAVPLDHPQSEEPAKREPAKDGTPC